jgi:hypothetical protein
MNQPILGNLYDYLHHTTAKLRWLRTRESVLPKEQELIPEYMSKYFPSVRPSVRPCVRESVPLQISVGCVYFV